jgi:tryptophanyl-tRNA synthetase
MSKSYDNGIFLSDSMAEIQKKMMVAKTDPARQRRTDPGDPDKCPVFDYHKVYSAQSTRLEVAQGCRTAAIGCIDCKKKLLSGMEARLAPALAKRLDLISKADLVDDVLALGRDKARQAARLQMDKIRTAMKI